MLSSSISSSVYQSTACHVTYGSMRHIDPDQKPSRGKPWSAILAQDFVHKVDILIPDQHFDTVHEKLCQSGKEPSYSRVSMSLEQVLEGEFFNEYIKRGNILMLSEGKTTMDNVFTLRRGTLTLYLDKETYERAGLVGKPFGTKGNRGCKPRWVVSYNLRDPSMLHGKKGFDRLVYASKKVLNKQVNWLFRNMTPPSTGSDPIAKHSPERVTCSPTTLDGLITSNVSLNINPDILAQGDRTELESTASDLYEWLSLLRLQSPRVRATDNIDDYLSRYECPEGASGQTSIRKLSWQGFISAEWVRDLVVEMLTTCPAKTWVAVSATCFAKDTLTNTNEVTMLRPPAGGGEFLLWEVGNIV